MSTLLEQASLIMIPSGYKEDVVYSVIPESGAGDLSFTRASNGTRVNSAGLVEVVAWNLQTYSEDFSNASWVKQYSPVMAYNVATAPNGTMTADSIQSNTASVYQSVSAPSLSIAPNSTVTLSIYIKKETSKTYFGGSYLYFTGGTTKLTYVLFDEVNGTINIVAPDQVSMVTSVESVGDWWRFIVTGTDTGGNTYLDYAFYGTLSQNGTTLNTGIGSARTIWGAQLNIGSTAKPYFPTTDRLNVPRLTYQNGGGGCPSLLLEKQSTNLVTYSEQFDDASWTKNVSVTANAIISPDGTQNADKILESASNVQQWAYQSFSMSGAQTATIYAKKGERNYIALATAGLDFSYFNLDTGVVVSSASGASASIQNAGNGWYRCSVNASSSTSTYFIVAISDNGTRYQYAGDTSKGVYVWGAQNEASSYATSYIQTQASSATRVADLINTNGKSALIGQTEGVIFADVVTISGDSDYVTILQLFGDSSNRLAIGLQVATTNLFGYLNAGGSVQFFNVATQASGRHKIAFAYKSGQMALYIDGISAFTSTSTFTFAVTLDTIFMNNLNGTAEIGSFKVNESVIFKTRLTNAELASLTTI